MKKKLVVISLGGSLIVPNKVDNIYLQRFKILVNKLRKQFNFVIVAGGGKTARDYISAMHGENEIMKSLVGIMATKLNARLVSSVFGLSENVPDTILEVKKELRLHGISISGALGFHSDMTTDGNAAQIAKELKASSFINLTNVDGLFDKDPKKFKDAKLIKKITYDKFFRIVNSFKYHPGQHFVLDQAAAVIIKKYKIKTFIINGKNFSNIIKLLNNKKYTGTFIS